MFSLSLSSPAPFSIFPFCLQSTSSSSLSIPFLFFPFWPSFPSTFSLCLPIPVMKTRLCLMEGCAKEDVQCLASWRASSRGGWARDDAAINATNLQICLSASVRRAAWRRKLQPGNRRRALFTFCFDFFIKKHKSVVEFPFSPFFVHGHFGSSRFLAIASTIPAR